MTPAVPPGNKKVVVIDDDEDFLALVLMILAGEGVEIIPCSSGLAGLEAIRSRRPAAVVLDLMLPDVNGWEIFMQMKQDPALENTPVIILTSHSTRPDRTFGLQVAQVHDFITKPCLPSRLRESVASALAKTAAA
jgi:CheY-like chemotaxis protein